ncbi:MAG: hypothetical protein JWQ11_4846, partial [Rhizobacter sp.]|nr:hypothetical protein [Rhizobacter sp.]
PISNSNFRSTQQRSQITSQALFTSAGQANRKSPAGYPDQQPGAHRPGHRQNQRQHPVLNSLNMGIETQKHYGRVINKINHYMQGEAGVPSMHQGGYPAGPLPPVPRTVAMAHTNHRDPVRAQALQAQQTVMLQRTQQQLQAQRTPQQHEPQQQAQLTRQLQQAQHTRQLQPGHVQPPRPAQAPVSHRPRLPVQQPVPAQQVRPAPVRRPAPVAAHPRNGHVAGNDVRLNGMQLHVGPLSIRARSAQIPSGLLPGLFSPRKLAQP